MPKITRRPPPPSTGGDAPEIRLAFSRAWRRGRKAAGLPSQADLSRAAGITQPEASRYESGRRLPSLPRFASLVKLTGIRPLPILRALVKAQRGAARG